MQKLRCERNAECCETWSWAGKAVGTGFEQGTAPISSDLKGFVIYI